MRGRQEESAVAFSYLQQLHTKHEEWLMKKVGVASYLVDTPVLVLDCDRDFENNQEILEEHLNTIAEFIGVCLLPPLKSINSTQTVTRHL
jgi:hypothetical protein